jgi:ABC-type polar amino acid transport system ATPase subunit
MSIATHHIRFAEEVADRVPFISAVRSSKKPGAGRPHQFKKSRRTPFA